MHLPSTRAQAGRIWGDCLVLLLFLIAAGWGAVELFFPDLWRTDARPVTLRPGRPAPDPAELSRRIRETPPAPPAPEWRPKALSNRWKWITVHHSATFTGNAESMGRYHRRRKGMENGLAYHFVIGNGSGSPDGKVEVGRRWREQIDGGHVHGDALNRIALGICLVGNFECAMPTRKQIASLKGLLNYLMEITAIPEERVKGHRDMPGQSTLCPGRYLPVGRILARRRPPERAAPSTPEP